MIRKIITAKVPLKKILKGVKTNVFIRRGCVVKSSNDIGKARKLGDNAG
jgi:hypothetical protein